MLVLHAWKYLFISLKPLHKGSKILSTHKDLHASSIITHCTPSTNIIFTLCLSCFMDHHDGTLYMVISLLNNTCPKTHAIETSWNIFHMAHGQEHECVMDGSYMTSYAILSILSYKGDDCAWEQSSTTNYED